MVNRTRVEGGGYSKHDIIARYDQQAGCNNIVDVCYMIILHIVTKINRVDWKFQILPTPKVQFSQGGVGCSTYWTDSNHTVKTSISGCTQ